MDGHKPMTAAEVAAFCQSLPGAVPRRPYGPQPLVFFNEKGKTFCCIYEDSEPLHLLMKCDPVEAELLRAANPGAIRPGYHSNKRHWNSVYFDGSIPEPEVHRMVRNAYLLASGRKGDIVPIVSP